MPAAEVDVSAELVGRLLADQHQDLAGRPVEFLANGWDNAMFRLGDDLLARLPRRAAAAQILLNEQRWLPVLAPGIQLPIPAPERTGRPALGYPFSWSVVRYLPGEPAADADSLDLASAADAVGGFLGSLHAPAPPDAPPTPTEAFRSPPGPTCSRPTSGCCPIRSTGPQPGAPGRRRWPRLATTARRGGCTATCTLPTSWSATAMSAA
jgi:aminoglycoside phosphotransferase (APT) family kinase protein